MIFSATLRARSLAAATFRLSQLSCRSPSALPPAAKGNAAIASPWTARSFSAEGKPSLTQLIKELRASTGAPMVECKKALSDPEVDGDLEKAADWLRKHGSARASSKVSGRAAAEGMVGLLVSPEGRAASIVKVASETDFASRSEAFGGLVEKVAKAALALGGDSSIDVDGSLLSAPVGEGAASTVKESLDEAILAIRENLQVLSASSLSASGGDSLLVGYVHGRIPNSTCAGTAAAVVEIAKTSDSKATTETMQDAGKKLAMHVVAARPDFLSPDTVPEDVIEREKAILMEQVADSGKPANIVEKMVNGRMRKFYEGVCLTEQPHMVEEGNPKVSKVLSELGLEARRFQKASVQ